MQFVLKEITTRSKMSADKKMGYVNNFTKVNFILVFQSKIIAG